MIAVEKTFRKMIITMRNISPANHQSLLEENLSSDALAAVGDNLTLIFLLLLLVFKRVDELFRMFWRA